VSLSFSIMSLGLLSVSGCALEVDYDDSRYTCRPSHVCPPGHTCSAQGFCEPNGGGDLADANPDAPDAIADAVTADADPNAPDAAPVPDAPDIDAPEPADAAPGPDAPLPPDAAPPPDAPPPPPDAGPPPTTSTFFAVKDTQLYSPDPTANFGDFAEIKCFQRTSSPVDSPVLFEFNTSSIPDGAIVQSASLRLTVSSQALTGGLAQVFVLNEDWAEGSGAGNPGVANYNQRFAGVPWSTPGARPPSRGTTPIGSFAANQTFTSFEIPLSKAAVQEWISDPSANFGLAVTCPLDKGAATFNTRAGSNSVKPRLTVTYIP
jgi:hypothetical protein